MINCSGCAKRRERLKKWRAVARERANKIIAGVKVKQSADTRNKEALE
ncbi:hypothetical protein GCM10027217_18310 [Pseudomaricurvus hydrocarbonicus]